MKDIFTEINDIKQYFKKLHYENIHKGIRLTGILSINHIYNDEHIVDEYNIEIVISQNYPNDFPKIREIGKKIPISYGHIYPDSELCLGTDADMIFNLGSKYVLRDWIEQYVIPYFFSFSYFKKYKVMPFGERNHGIKGELEFYFDYFNVSNKVNVIQILNYICNKTYKGHHLCPCGSGKRIRDCHKDLIIHCKENYKEFLKEELKKFKGVI